ncbi:TPA: hypothetical protein RQN23_002965 [Aeromonas veronii]|nr:hypothetical protein [Aeromonas veronii]
MDSSVSSISNFIEGFGWLYYAFIGIGALFVIAAVQAFRSQYHVAKAKVMGITNPELQEIIKQWDIKPPKYWLHGLFYCVCMVLSIMAALLFK